jgi:hypothetical protein
MPSIFEANILALSVNNQRLYSRISGAGEESKHYAFLTSRDGEIVPAFNLPSGNTQPLHSLVDPKREAQRLASTVTDDTGFVICLGLGGGFIPEAVLNSTAARVLVIDYRIDGIAELFSSKDYTNLLKNGRFFFLADPSDDEIKTAVLEQYIPVLCGGIKTIPLRTRTEQDLPLFENAAAIIQEAIKTAAADYSVQAHFGKRWFSNIIRNLKTAEDAAESFTARIGKFPVQETAIVAAGPSLDQQIPSLEKLKKSGTFIISSDTALPALLQYGIEPDAVVSIDCQHISYYHFLGCNLNSGSIGIPLILDIASPPLLSSFSPSPFFFSSGHPLALYISQRWRPLPRLDTSGGNVTYACLSLAENLGAKRITLFGADFSYVRSRTYARGTYIYPFFEKKQNRLFPLEAQFSAFLYRSAFLPPEKTGQMQNYYETSTLRFYREKLEEKAAAMSAQIIAAQGQGAPVNLTRKTSHNARSAALSNESFLFPAEKASMSHVAFLEQYLRDIAALPAADGNADYMRKLNAKDRQVFTTLLPLAAAVKHRATPLKPADLLEETKRVCAREIQKVLESDKF